MGTTYRRTVIPLGCSLLNSSSDLPGGADAPSQHVPRRRSPSCCVHQRTGNDGGAPSLFGLAPCGACPARCITAAAVRSCRTFSPLPRRSSQTSIRKSEQNSGAVYFLWRSPSTGLKTGFPDVIRHTALWSSDFPPASQKRGQRPSGPAAYINIIWDSAKPPSNSSFSPLAPPVYDSDYVKIAP
jgi:hypothetical protein